MQPQGHRRGGEGWVALAGQRWQPRPGVGAAMGSRPCPGHVTMTQSRPPPAAVPACPVICITDSNLFHRKPSHWGCRGELWLVWAGARAALLLSWGSVTINASAGVLVRAQPQPGIAALPTPQQRAERQPRPQAACPASWLVPDPPRFPTTGTGWLR